MAGADLAAVDAVVAEVVVGDAAVVVADEVELGDGCGVEGDLGLGVAGDEVDVAGQLLAEDVHGLVLVGDIGGVAVALVGKLFHQGVAVLAADADTEEGDAVLAAGGGDPLQDGVRVGVAGVGERVGDQHDPVGGVLAQALHGGVVAGLHTGAEVGGVADLQAVDRVVHRAAVAAEAGHGQDGLRLVGEGDQGDGVVVAQPVGHHVEGRACEVEAARLGHGAGDVDDERERGGRAFAVGEGLAGGEADADEGPVLFAGAGPVDGDGEAVAVGAFVVLAEAVDELLGADLGRVGAPPLGEQPAGVVPRGGVDVEGEGGQVVAAGFGVHLVAVGVPFAAARMAGCVPSAVAVRGRDVVAAAAAGEQQAAECGERGQRPAEPWCAVPVHRACPP
ncbi:hypothetical protein GCM10020256_49930 [Streptomyces thermocoprophilus]